MRAQFTSEWLAAHNARLNHNKVREPVKADEGREEDLHYKIIDECKRRGWVYIHSRMDRAATNQVGTPDFIIFGQLTRDGITDWRREPGVWAIECKSRVGKLSPAQNAMRAHLEKLGHRYYVVRSMAEFIEVIK